MNSKETIDVRRPFQGWRTFRPNEMLSDVAKLYPVNSSRGHGEHAPENGPDLPKLRIATVDTSVMLTASRAVANDFM